MTALDIITQARERLGDEKKQRWSDTRLLSIVSQGQVNICLESGYLRKKAILPLVEKQNIYQLPSDCYSIKRVEFDGKLLPLHMRSDEDVPRALTADYTAYKSNLNMDKMEIYPSPTDLDRVAVFVAGEGISDTIVVNPPLGVITSNNYNPTVIIEPVFGVSVSADLTYNSAVVSNGYGEIGGSSLDTVDVGFSNTEFGVTVSAEYTTSTNKFGFITSVENHTIASPYGIVADVVEEKGTFNVYYVAIPSKLQYLSSILLLPVIWEELLLRYVVGTALQDDNDSNNLTRGEAELQKYNTQLETIKELSSQNFSKGTSDKYDTTFRRI